MLLKRLAAFSQMFGVFIQLTEWGFLFLSGRKHGPVGRQHLKGGKQSTPYHSDLLGGRSLRFAPPLVLV